MCVHSYCWISGSMCMRYNYNTFMLFLRGCATCVIMSDTCPVLCYAIPVLPACTLHVVCMLVAHNTCTIHTETSAPVVCCHYTFCFLYLQDPALYQACTRRDAVRAKELLVLGANVNCRGRVSYIVPTCTSTSGCMCCVSIQCILVQAQ